MKKRNKGVKVIGCWMVLVSLSGIYNYVFSHLPLALDKLKLDIPTVETAFYVLVFMASLGLFFNKEWARKISALLFFVYSLWSIYVVYFITGPSLKFLIVEYSEAFAVSEVILKTTLATILITYVFWPIFVVLFLTHPRVKKLFDPNAEEEG
ncbi:MAG: hypothetical protein A2Z88_00940 [Omnitrophica WOR_2 bacterium GWA2_47_8]|nr:MAG: hypothetical protein A2Z88_00940 [Omnitrophica WOR_2 bacterium GWA2_47_8]